MWVWQSKGGASAEPEEAADELAQVIAAQIDPAAFDLLYRRYLPPIYRYVRAQVHSAEDAADLTQQIFLQALDALPSFQPRGLPFAAWLFRIARHAVIDSYRQRKRVAIPFDAVPESRHPRSEDDPLAHAEIQERDQRLMQLVNTLDHQKRELVILRFAGQLSSTEIAAVVGKTPAAVQKQLTRILAELKRHYHDA